jgi:hypothetical protein
MKKLASYRNLEALLSVVRKFEACAYDKAEFTHNLHLTVAAWYLWTSTPAEALDRMRASLLRFTKHHNVQGYHETISRFWMLLLRESIVQGEGDRAFVKRVNDLLERFADKNILFEYYTRELVMSDRARAIWVEPDLKPLAGTYKVIAE